MKKRKVKRNFVIVKPKQLRINYKGVEPFIMLLLFVFGSFAGALIIKNSGDKLVTITGKTFDIIKSFGFGASVVSALIYDGFFSLLSFLIGCSVIGSVFVYAEIIIKGFINCAFLSGIFCKFGLKGLGYSAFIFIPPQVLSTLVLIFSLIISREMSLYAFERTFMTSTGRAQKSPADYLKKQGVLFAAVILSSVIYALLKKVFASFFVF